MNKFTVNPKLQNNAMTQRKPKQNNHRSQRTTAKLNRRGCKYNRCEFNGYQSKAKTVTAITPLCTA